ncbi:MAG: peroxiredoxin family protein [Candidatus Omnitrophota bacterium]
MTGKNQISKKVLYRLGIMCAFGFLSTAPVHAADMNASSMKKIGLDEGAMAPDFEGISYEGKTVKLSEMYQNGPVVLIFYRGAWCPYCVRHLRSFQDRLDEIRALGADVLAVSVDQQEFAQKTVSENTLGFEVITDPAADILKEYNLIFQVPDELAEKYKNEYKIDLELHSGRTDHVIAVPATFIIANDGQIIFAYANEDYKVRTEPQEVIDALKEMQLYN